MQMQGRKTAEARKIYIDECLSNSMDDSRPRRMSSATQRLQAEVTLVGKSCSREASSAAEQPRELIFQTALNVGDDLTRLEISTETLIDLEAGTRDK